MSTPSRSAAARAFASYGAHVAVHYNASRDAAEHVVADVRSLGGEAVLVAGDVTQSGNVKRIVAETLAALGRLDVLINNAGGLVARTRIEDYSEPFLHQVIALNVIQVALFMHEVIPIMRKQQYGRVVVTTSGSGTVGNFGQSNYGAAKMAVNGLINVLRLEPSRISIERYSWDEAAQGFQPSFKSSIWGLLGSMFAGICPSLIMRSAGSL